MAKLKDISIGSKNFEIYYEVGTVLKESKRSETKVSGGGGSISTVGGHTSGSVSEVVAHTTVYDDIIIADKTGKEHSYQFSDFDLVCREGNELGVVWAYRKGENKDGHYVMVINNSTNKKFFDQIAIEQIWRLKVNGVAGCGLLLAILFGIGITIWLLASYFMFGILLLGGGGFWLFQKMWQRKKELAQFKVELNSVQFSDLK